MYELIEYRDGKIIVPQEVTKQIAEFEKMKMQIDLIKEELKEELLEAMEEHNILSFQDENIKVSYRSATTRTSIDSKRLKKEMPEVYEEYSKESNVKSSVSIEALDIC